MKGDVARSRGPQLYNGPEETCVRVMALLEAAHPTTFTAGELSPFDHAVVHTADFGGPDSLHPCQPHRGDEIAVRLPVLGPALDLGVGLGMVDATGEGEARRYAAGDDMCSNLPMFLGEYGEELFERAKWLFGRFDGGSDAGRAELLALIAERDRDPVPEEDWADESRTLDRFAMLELVYVSDLARMGMLATAAEAFSVQRFCLRRKRMYEVDDLAARTLGHAYEPAMLALRDAALREIATIRRDRVGLAEVMRDLRGEA